ncbi:MAG: LuxR C-terminal-related transcriptional regulator [Gammaproteobacteria bacterium]|nr:LuxR C-terminal-related transcriptional regulator [Gammaproteobacteria bacterium]
MRKGSGNTGPKADAAVTRGTGIETDAPWDRVPWLQRQRVLLPDPVDGYLDRPELERRCGLMGHRLTLLSAPAGFGKTALLAHRCRDLREQGIRVAWLSLDQSDGPEALATYLLAAFQQAGVEIFNPQGTEAVAELGSGPDQGMSSEVAYRLSVLIAAVERLAAPCLLALDDVECLRDMADVRVLNVVLERAPANLRFAMAYRQRPTGLNIATPLLDASSVRVSAEQLRLSDAEIARFFRTPLSGGARRAIVKQSVGWPLALRIFRNAQEDGHTPEAGADTLASWIESRLWRGLAEKDRELVLDMALFDWFDAELMDEVLDGTDASARIAGMHSLNGLLQTTANGTTMRLHPLIGDYGASRRQQETPDRFRSIHAAIARSLVRRRQTVEALRHANAAKDTELIGRIAERSACLTAAVHDGPDVTRKIIGMLNDEIFSEYPRLALARCQTRTQAGDIEAAERDYRGISIRTAGFTRDRPDGDDLALGIEHKLLLGLMHVCGCRPHGMAEVAGIEEVADLVAAGIDLRIRSVFAYGICVASANVAEFGQAQDWGKRALAQLGERSHLAPRVLYELGQMAMAAGRTEAAASYYGDGLAIARSSYLRDSGAVAIGRVRRDELALEQTGDATPLGRGASLRLLGESAAVSSVYAASLGVLVQQALSRGDTEKAALIVEDAREYALRTRRPALAKHVAALEVTVLLADEQVEEATRAWQFDGLPESGADCLDIQRRGWRQTEMLATTRVRLCIARGHIQAAKETAAGMLRLAESRHLTRTVMRAEALSMVVALRVGDEPAAMGHLAAFVRHYAETGYAAGLATDHDVTVTLLDRLAEGQTQEAAGRLADVLRRRAMRGAATARVLTAAQIEVLELVARGEPDKRIASRLHLSVDGVRYRLRTAFAKLGVRNRFEAVLKARATGIMPSDAAPGS